MEETKGKGSFEPKPAVGRIVHYISYGTPNGEYKPEHRAAIITSVNYATEDESTDPEEVKSVDLCILNPTGMFFSQRLNQGTREGQWHWPERV